MSAGQRDLQPDTSIAATVTGTLAQRELAVGEIVGERFRVLRILGMGGMGLVYLAHDTELDIDVALKLLRPELASRPDAFERFRKELLLARQVSSPHVVRIHDLVRHKQAWLISMDYVAGQSLERLLSEQRSLSPQRALQITRQLALGLAAAHHSQVVHRDLKPANVLVNEQGDVSITDFGVARIAGETGITGSGVVIGTPEYLSPEQARAEPLDGRSDLYALGLILFEMLTGTLPFRGGTPAEMLVQRIVRDPPAADTIKPGLPPLAVKLCARLLELRVSRRIQTAEQVVQAIDAGKVPGHLPSQRRRRQVTASIAALLLLGAIGYAWWPETKPETAVLQAPAMVSSLDLLPLPWASDDSPQATQLAAGIRYLLAESLSLNPALHSADSLRVDRALVELDYDAQAADRQHQRVLEVMAAKLALEGEVRRQDERWLVKLRLVNADSPVPQWSAELSAADAEIPQALASLGDQLFRQLGLPAAAIAWPQNAQLRALGQATDARFDAEQLSTIRLQAQDAGSASLWWLLLYQLDRGGRGAEAAELAVSARDASRSDTSLGGRRTLAFAELLLGETEQAQTLLSELIDAAPSDHPSRLLHARAQAELGDFEVAIGGLKALIEEDPRNLDAWYSLGRYSIQAGDAKSAVDDYLVRAQVLSNRLEDPHMRAEVSHAMGVGYRRLGQMDAAAEQLRRAIELRHDLGERRGEAVSLQNLSMVLSMQGQFDPAEAALSQAQAITRELGDSLALANLANAQGTLAEERGNYRAALDAYRDSLRLRQSLGDQRSIGESLNNVGFAYYQLGEFDNAQTYWQQSAATFEEIDDRAGTVHAQQSLALAQIARGDWPAARQLLQQSLSTAESLQMAEERAISLATLAELDRLEGQMDSALHRADTALSEFERRKDPRGIAEMRLLQAAIASDLGDWAGAEQAIAELGSDQVSEQLSQLRWRQAEITLGQGRVDEAIQQADAAIAQALDARSYAAELQARLLKARALHAAAEPAAAKAELSLVQQGLVRYASVPLQLRLREAELQLLQGLAARSAYQQASKLLARLPAYGRAFVIHQRGAGIAELGTPAITQARALAARAMQQLLQHTPDDRQQALRAYAGSLGMPMDSEP